jgi:hypothetical protein
MTSRDFRWAALLLALSLIGCSSSGDPNEPTPREVRNELAKLLADREEHMTLTDFQPDGEHQYKATAKDSKGATYQLTVTTKGRTLHFDAKPDDPDGNFLSGYRGTWPEPPFDERHPDLMQWLRASLCALHTLGVIWPIMGLFGWRRRYSPTTERVLTVFALVNVGFALYWGYQYVNNLGAS